MKKNENDAVTGVTAIMLLNALKECTDAPIVDLRSKLEEARNHALGVAQSPQSQVERDYWKMHKIVVGINSDRDFSVWCQDDHEFKHDVWLEWAGETKEAAIEAASTFLKDRTNYHISDSRFDSLFKCYFDVAFELISSGKNTEWCSGGNWEIDVSYEEPDEKQPQHVPYRPTFDIMGIQVDLLSDEESQQAELIRLEAENND